MNLTRILWGSLAGACGVIVLLVSAWASDTTSRQTLAEQRLNTVESHYAAIQSDVSDLRDHIKDIEELLREQKGNK